MRACIHQPNYLPYLGIFNKIKNSELFVVYDIAQYVKDRFDNRNLIKTATGTQWLTIPLQDKDSFLKRFYEVKLPRDDFWKKDHLRSIKVNYAKVKHFHKYFPKIKKIYEKNHIFLADFTLDIIKFLMESFKIKTPIVKSRDLNLDLAKKSTEMIIQILNKVEASEYLAGASGKNYMDTAALKMAGIKVKYQHFKHPIYTQLFKHPFVKNLAAIDLLFNEGPDAKKYI